MRRHHNDATSLEATSVSEVTTDCRNPDLDLRESSSYVSVMPLVSSMRRRSRAVLIFPLPMSVNTPWFLVGYRALFRLLSGLAVRRSWNSPAFPPPTTGGLLQSKASAFLTSGNPSAPIHATPMSCIALLSALVVNVAVRP